MGKQWEGCPLILFLGFPPPLSTGNQCYQLIENPTGDTLCILWYKQTWIFSLLVLSPNHFSDSLLSIPTALVGLLRCFGLLPALHFRLRFSLVHIHFHSAKGSQSAQKGVQHDSAWSCGPWGIHLLSPPCHAFGTQFFLTHLPIPNQGYLKKNLMKARGLIRHWTHCFASVSLFTDPEFRISILVTQNFLSLPVHALHMIFLLQAISSAWNPCPTIFISRPHSVQVSSLRTILGMDHSWLRFQKLTEPSICSVASRRPYWEQAFLINSTTALLVEK